MVAQSPDRPRLQIFRSQPARAHRLEQRAELSVLARPPVLAREAPAPGELMYLMMRLLLLREATAFFLASLFPLLLAPLSFPGLFWIFARFPSREISSSPLSVWALASDAALTFRTESVRASRAGSPLQKCQIHFPRLASLISRGE